MSIDRTRRALGAALVAAPFAGLARAEEFPARPIRIVVAFAPGGTADISTRIVAERLSTQLGRPVIVDNRPGAGGITGAEQVAAAPADGYTLLMSGNHVAIAQLLSRSARYDAVRSFSQIARFAVVPSGLFVNAGSPITSLESMLAYARSHPDTVTYASGGTGTPSHLAMEILQKRTGIPIRHIPYKGTGPALNDLAGGQVDILCDQTSGTVPLVKAGRIKAQAAAGRQRLPQLPEVPALSEAGVQGFDINISFGLYAPKGTPRPVLDTLVAALQKSVADPEVRQRLEGMGISAVPVELARPEALRAHLKNEIDTLGGLLIKAGVKPE